MNIVRMLAARGAVACVCTSSMVLDAHRHRPPAHFHNNAGPAMEAPAYRALRTASVKWTDGKCHEHPVNKTDAYIRALKTGANRAMITALCSESIAFDTLLTSERQAVRPANNRRLRILPSFALQSDNRFKVKRYVCVYVCFGIK